MIYSKVKRLKYSIFILLALVLFGERANAQVPVHPDSCSRNVLEFDGTDDFVSVSIPGFSYARGTIEAWVRKDNWQDAEDDALFSNGIGNSDPNSFYVSFHPVVGLHFRYGGSEAGAVYAGSNPLSPPISTANLAPGSWHHVAVVWNNYNGQTHIAAYLDGNFATSGSTSTNLVLAGGTDFLIGGGVSGSHSILQSGSIAELRVWSTNKSGAAISQDRNLILSGTEPALIAYLPMNNAVGTSTVKDMVSGNNATLNNMTLPNTSMFKPLEVAVAATKIADQGSYDFGIVSTGGNSGDINFTVTNIRPTTIDLSNTPFVTLGGVNADQFTLDLTNTATSLAAGASTTFTVRFNPSSLGEKKAQLSISHLTDCSNPYVINISGRSPFISYSGGFSEVALNDGSVTGSLTITLAGDTFQDIDADSKLDIGSEVTVNNIPAGLTPAITLSSATVAVLTLTGNANTALHQNSNDVSDITFSFDNSAFTNLTPAQITNASAPSSSGVGIDFQENTATIIYSGAGFEEVAHNKGIVSGDISVILSGDTFQDNDADGLLDIGSEVTINNIPAGLTPKLSIKHNTRPGKIWTSHNVESYGWVSVAYGNGQFVAVASSGTYNIMTSPDGITWTPVKIPGVGYWSAITYGNGLFVVVSDSGTNRIMTSPDGINWTVRTVSGESSWSSVTYGNGLFVAVASYGDNRIMTSPDGINWTVRAAPQANDWTTVAYGNGVFVAVSFTGSNRVMTSPDGINWTLRSIPGTYLQSVTYGGSLFVAVGHAGAIMTSSDGINWSAYTVSNGTLSSVSYGDGLFVAINRGTNGVVVSPDGINWSIYLGAEANNWESVTYGNGIFVAVSSSGINRVMSSGVLAKLSLEGVATLHANAQDVTDITFNFDNSAFVDTPIANVTNATGPASSSLGVNFNDNNGLITYSGSGFTESVTNEGAVSGSITMDLSGGETFQDTDTDNLLDVDTEYSLLGLPDGLVVQLTLNSPTQAVLSFGGNAYLHQDENDLSDLQLVFKNEAFTGGNAAAVGNAIGPASTGLGIDFNDNTVVLSYVGESFKESERNDGSVTGTMTITLTGDTFQDVNTNNQLQVGTEVALSNIPVGLNPVFNLISSTEAQLTLAGKAIDHQYAQSVGNIAITFSDQAFSATSAKAVANANTFSLPTKIEFEDNRAAIAYSGAGFTEAVANDGTVTGSITVTLSGEHFQDTDTDNVLDIAAEVEINNVPSGLTPVLTIDSNQPIGKNWTVHQVIEGVTWNSVAYGNNLFVAVSNSNTRPLVTSPDGINWTSPNVVGYYWNTVVYRNGLFMAFSNDNVITSPDGVNWTLLDLPSNNLKSITYANGLFVGVGSNIVMTSPDGINWTAQTPAANKAWSSITYGNGLYVATGYSAFSTTDAIMTSPDGINWTLRQSHGARQLRSIVYGDGLFVVVTSRGASTTSTADRILTSSNGIDWTLRDAPEANTWYSVTYGQGHFVAVASTGTNQVMTSPDGINWTAHAAAAAESWQNVLFANGRAIAMSSNRVMISEASASATLTLTGQVDKHQNAQDVSDVTFTFKDSAFGTFAAAGVDKATGPASSEKGIDFQDNGSAPVITDIPNQSISALETLSFSVSATDSDVPSQTLTYKLNQASLDLGMGIDANTGAFNWAPVTAHVSGNYTVEVEVADEFLSAKKTFDIQVLKANQTITFNALSARTFGDASFDLNATAGAGTTLTYASSNTNVATVSGNTVTIVGVGTANITANQSGNASFNSATEVIQSLVINPRALTITADAKSKTYGDVDPTLTYQISSGSLAGSDVITGNLSRTSGEDANTYAINQNTLTAGSNYSLTYVSANLTIGTKALTITADAKSKIYGEADPALTYQITSGSLVGSEVITGSLSRTSGEDANTYAINQNTLTAGSNYSLTYVSANLTIGTKALTITADAKSKTYGDVDPTLTYQISSGSLVGSDAISGSLSRTPGEDVNAYAINQNTLAAGSNYSLTYVSANLTIGTKALTITADAKSKTYGDTDPAFTYQITSGSLVGSDVITGSLSRTSGEDVNAYAINQNTLTAGSNYNLTYVSANLTIGTKALTITADAKSKTYGDVDPTLTYQITSGSLVGSDVITGSLSRTPGEDVNTYAINQNMLTVGSNYSLTYVSANLTIGTKALTITTDAKSKIYGEADPSLTYQITSGSLVGSDAISGNLDRATGENVGVYTINQNTLTVGSNYNLTYVPANLTIRAIGPIPIGDDDCSRTVLEFDGIDDYLDVDIPDFSASSGTIEAWVRKDNWQDGFDDALFTNGLGHGSSNSFYLSFHPAVGLHFRYGGGSDVGNAYASSGIGAINAMAANSWHHIAATWYNDGDKTTLVTYIDGVQVGTSSTSANLVIDAGTAFGISKGVAGSHYVIQGGAVADVRVWNVPRTQMEIDNNKDILLLGDELGLIAYWPLNDASGTTNAANLVAGANEAVLQNMNPTTDWVSFPVEIKVASAALGSSGYNFGFVSKGASSESIVFTLTNKGSGTVNFSGSPLTSLQGADTDQFTLDLTGASNTLTTGESTTFTVTFNPTSNGNKTASLSFTNVEGCGDPYIVNLSGSSGYRLDYSGSLIESDTNVGAITGAITMTLSGGASFQNTDNDNALSIGTEVTVNNIPAGLTPEITLTSATTAELTLQGNAEAHQIENSVADITFEFMDAAFDGTNATSVFNATGPAGSGIGIDFKENTVQVIYKGTGYAETEANNGTVSGSIDIILGGDTFQDDDADNVLDVGSEVFVNNVPAGLVPHVDIINNTLAGEAWEAHDSGIANGFSGITYGNGLFVAVNYSSQVITSPDGENWTERTSVEGANSWTTVTYGNGLFVAVARSGPTRVMTSTDGINWTAQTAAEANSWQDVTYGNGQFVAVGSDGLNRVMTSPDGINWTARLAAENNTWWSVTYGNGVFVAVARDGVNRIMSSSDGITWTSYSDTMSNLWYDIAYGNGLFVAVGGSNLITSPDGVNWTLRSVPVSGYTNVATIAYGNGIFAIVGGFNTNKTYTSSDGISWDIHGSATDTDWRSSVYGEGTFVTISSNTGHQLMTSKGAIAKLSFTGTAVDHQDVNDVSDIALSFSDDAFVNALASGVINATEPASSGIGIDFTDNGTAPVVTDIANQSITILQSLSFNVIASDSDLPAQTLSYSLDQASIDLGMSIDANGGFSWTPGILNVGNTYTVEVKVADEFLSTVKSFEVQVTKVNQTITFNTLATRTYGDNFELTTTGGGSGNAVTYTSSNTNVATISGSTVTLIGAGSTIITASQSGNASYNPAANVTQSLVVNAKAITIIADVKSKAYGEADPALTYQITSGTLVGTDAISGSLIRTAGEDVGTYAVSQNTLTAGSNYNVTYVSANLTIDTRAITITADAKSKTYGEVDPAFTYQITSGTLVGADAVSGSLSRTAGEDVNTYVINQNTLTAGANYNLTYISANLTIGTRAITITADSKSKIYGEADPALTYQVTSGALVGTDVITGNLNRTAGEDVGAYIINQNTLVASSNYSLTYVPANLTIGKRAITITAEAKSKTYGDSDPALTNQITSGDLVGSDAITGSLSREAGENVGTYAINQNTLTAGSNYNLTYVSANLIIERTVLTAIADNKSKTYGEENPTLTTSYSGFVNGEDKTVITEPTISTTATATTDAGTVPIILSGGSATNYSIVMNNGTLTIGKANLTVTADDKTFNKGGEAPEFTISFNGFVNSEDQSVIDVIPSASSTVTTSSDRGSYAISLSAGSDNNYEIFTQNGTVTLTGPVYTLPTSIDFGQLVLGDVGSETITFDNTGDGGLSVSGITLPVGYSLSQSSFSVANGSSTSITLTFTPTAAQIYAGDIVITSNNGQEVIAVSGEGQIVTGIENDRLDAKAVKLYPNPSDKWLTIDLSESPAIEVNLKLLNAQGQVTWKKDEVREKEVVVRTATFTSGFYLLVVESSKGSVIKKVMVKH